MFDVVHKPSGRISGTASPDSRQQWNHCLTKIALFRTWSPSWYYRQDCTWDSRPVPLSDPPAGGSRGPNCCDGCMPGGGALASTSGSGVGSFPRNRDKTRRRRSTRVQSISSLSVSAGRRTVVKPYMFILLFVGIIQRVGGSSNMPGV